MGLHHVDCGFELHISTDTQNCILTLLRMFRQTPEIMGEVQIRRTNIRQQLNKMLWRLAPQIVFRQQKTRFLSGFFDKMAERGGFEPPVPFGTPDFESGTFSHSDTSPRLCRGR